MSEKLKVGFVGNIYGTPKGHSYFVRDLLQLTKDAGHETHMYRLFENKITDEFVLPDTLESSPGRIIEKADFEKWLDKYNPDICLFFEYSQWWKEDHNKVKICKDRNIRTIGWLVYERLDWNDIAHYKLYDDIICPTEFQTKLMRGKGIYNVVYVPWAVNFLEMLEITSMVKPPNDKITFFHCAGNGGVGNRKNTNAVIEAYNKIRDETTDLKITHLNSCVLSRKELLYFMSCADVLINTSKWDSIGLNCQPKGSLVYTSYGITRIENIRIGDYVLTHKNRFKKVINTLSGRNTTYNIKCDYTGDIKLTGEHPCLVLPITKNEYKRKKINIEPKWEKTENLQPYNFLAVPKPKEIKHTNYLTITDYIDVCNIEKTDKYVYNKYSKNMKGVNFSIYTLAEQFGVSKNTIWRILNNVNTKIDKLSVKTINELYDNYKIMIPKKIKVDKSLCKLLGFFVAEGWTEKKSAFGFAFHTKEKDYHNFVLKSMKNIFNLDGKIITIGNKTNIMFYNSVVCDFFETLCKKYAMYKDVPTFLLHEKIELQKEFLKGYFYGDGSIQEKSVTASTVSKNLAYNIKYILLRCNILSKVTKYKSSNKIWNSKDFYRIYLAFSKNMCELFNLEYKKPRYEFYLEDENYFYVNIRNIKKENKQSVFNITVEDDNSYCGEVVLHNSLEANSLGVPVIVCNTEPMNEIVKDTVNGLLVDGIKTRNEYVTCPSFEVDISELAKKMSICKNKLILDTLKSNSRKYAETNFNWKNNKEHFLKLLRKLE